jgi:ABC-type bacteriocin/lantibiotic exporter with double-glycine peptidase domain
MNEPALIQVRGLRFQYPGADRDVLRIPALDVTTHGMTAITGPSGVGKSTLIELLAGTLRGPYDGSLVVLGKE